jgi:15-cis-phytoene synthase
METASVIGVVRVSQWVESSCYCSLRDDALKDEDNAAWVMQLESSVRQEWLERIRWIRLADRLAELELLDLSCSMFRDFLKDWQSLCDRGDVPSGCHPESVLRSIAACWFEKKSDRSSPNSIAVWNAYLDALATYHRSNLTLERLSDYDRMLENLTGNFFQILPFLAPENWQAARSFGIVDQFYNNLRDLGEDASQGICYFPTEILERFGVDRSEILQFACFDNPGYYRLIEFWLDEYLPILRQQTQLLERSSHLHPSWEMLRDWSLARYDRIERIFRDVRFDYAQFPQVYWAAVRRDLGYPICITSR